MGLVDSMASGDMRLPSSIVFGIILLTTPLALSANDWLAIGASFGVWQDQLAAVPSAMGFVLALLGSILA